jgi:CheY-like chemotaxis protein
MFNLGKERELPTLLLIDDDLVSREVLATVLTMEGYTVHTAETGASALDQIDGKQCVPGLILMDAQMPGLSGAELIAELRRRSRAPLVAISGSNPPDEIRSAADAFLLKPFSASAVTQLLDRRAQAAAPPPGPARLPDVPVVSPATLQQFHSLMPPEAVNEIYTSLVTDMTARMDAMDAALAAADAAQLRRIAHSIKGGCAMAGALQAARIAAQIESGSNHLDNMAPLLIDLRLAHRNLERVLKSGFPA